MKVSQHNSVQLASKLLPLDFTKGAIKSKRLHTTVSLTCRTFEIIARYGTYTIGTILANKVANLTQLE